MAVVKKVDFKLKVDINVSIKYQILTYCFFNDVLLTKTDLEFLYELSLNAKIEIAKFCEILTNRKIFKSSQSARNAISKIEKKGLLIKAGNNKKTITINKAMNVQTNGLVLLDYKILGNDSKEA
ncbi:MAG: hypothetical protein ACI81I_000651 [Arcobacteraceae bacterium]|jgi:hypothetical protein|tara:strand:- start:663 stop:1034 length:372 start_codon:yes stop_codon:yes gene_type:complete